MGPDIAETDDTDAVRGGEEQVGGVAEDTAAMAEVGTTGSIGGAPGHAVADRAIGFDVAGLL